MLINYTCGPKTWQAMSVEEKARANHLAHKLQAVNPASVFYNNPVSPEILA
jgi:hypothetical protein